MTIQPDRVRQHLRAREIRVDDVVSIDTLAAVAAVALLA
jgi:hypothetical protein